MSLPPSLPPSPARTGPSECPGPHLILRPLPCCRPGGERPPEGPSLCHPRPLPVSPASNRLLHLGPLPPTSGRPRPAPLPCPGRFECGRPWPPPRPCCLAAPLPCGRLTLKGRASPLGPSRCPRGWRVLLGVLRGGRGDSWPLKYQPGAGATTGRAGFEWRASSSRRRVAKGPSSPSVRPVLCREPGAGHVGPPFLLPRVPSLLTRCQRPSQAEALGGCDCSRAHLLRPRGVLAASCANRPQSAHCWAV